MISYSNPLSRVSLAIWVLLFAEQIAADQVIVFAGSFWAVTVIRVGVRKLVLNG